MKRITDIFTVKKKTLSFEFFPPKTSAGEKNLYEKVAPRLAELKPDFFSVTCTAEGKDISATEKVAVELQNMFPDIAVMEHISIAAVGSTRAEMLNYLDALERGGVIRNILALRGDNFNKISFKIDPDIPRKTLIYASDLCRLIKEHYINYFSVGVAAYPDGHPECKTISESRAYLSIKFEEGADFAITQFFFDNNRYFSLVEKTGHSNKRIIPGILPVTDYGKLVSFAAKCGVSIPQEAGAYFSGTSDIKTKGAEYAFNQSKKLLEGGAPGVHIFTLNQSEVPFDVASRLKSGGIL